MNSCRLCKADSAERLFKYGVRHYAHAHCGFKHWGVQFLDRLHVWQLRQLPAKAMIEVGLTAEALFAYIRTRKED